MAELNQTAANISEQLFQAIDAIITERLRVLPYDKTVIATIIDNSNALYGKYKVTTDDNITFDAYADVTAYPLQQKVYVRIPEGNYNKQKVITGRYVPPYADTMITDLSTNNELLTTLNKQINQLVTQLDEIKNT